MEWFKPPLTHTRLHAHTHPQALIHTNTPPYLFSFSMLLFSILNSLLQANEQSSL